LFQFKKKQVDWDINYEEIDIEKKLGEGAFGEVFKGKWRHIDVAVKKLKAEPEGKELDDFLVENDTMKHLRPSKHVVTYYGMSSNPVCIITEYMAGGSLAPLLKSDKPLPPVIRMATQISLGMLHLHSEKVIHRDLSARNLLLDESMNIKIADFGLARLNASTPELNITASNIGPIKWMAPECIIRKEYSFASDVWAYGITLIEIITRNPPYPGLSALDVAVKVSREGLVPTVPPNTPSPLDNIMALSWSEKPEDRPSFEKICQILEKIEKIDQ